MTLDHLERRVRHAVQLEATVTTVDGDCRSTFVNDLSLDGCCISGFYAIGELVEMEIRPIGKFKAQVRWAFMGKAGLRFTKSNRPKTVGTLAVNKSGAAVIEYCVAAALIALLLVAALMS